MLSLHVGLAVIERYCPFFLMYLGILITRAIIHEKKGFLSSPFYIMTTPNQCTVHIIQNSAAITAKQVLLK